MFILTYPLSLRAFTVFCPSAAAVGFMLTGRSDKIHRQEVSEVLKVNKRPVFEQTTARTLE